MWGRCSPGCTARVPSSIARSPRSVSFGSTLAYGVPTFGLAAPFFFVQFYFLNFATDVLLMAPAVVGFILAVGRVWDGISDPMVGFLSDRTRTRLGRRRPWMLAATLPTVLAFVAVWSPPGELQEGAITLWTAAALLAFTTAATGWSIPHSALGAELSDDPHVRSRIFGVRQVFLLLGAACSFGGMQLVINAGDPRAAAARLALVVALGMLLLLLIPPLALRERPEFQGRGPLRPLPAIRDVLANPHGRRILFVWFVDQLGMASQGAVAPFMAIYILERPDAIGVFPAFYIGPMILSVPLWIRLSRRFGKRNVWLVAMLGAAASYASLFGLEANDLVLAAVLLAGAGFWSGCGGPLGPSLLAEVIDYDERRTGERKEGIYFAAWALVQKTSTALVVLVVGIALQLSGFEANAEQSPAADLAIRFCLAGLPCLMFAVGALAFRGFSLDEDALVSS